MKTHGKQMTPKELQNISHHFAAAQSARHPQPIPTSSSQSARLYTSTTPVPPSAPSRVTSGPPAAIRDDYIYFSAAGLLFSSLNMISQSFFGSLRKHVNDYGFTFFMPADSPTDTPDHQSPKPHVSSDDEGDDSGNGHEEDLEDQLANLNIAHAGAPVTESRTRRHTEPSDRSTHRHSHSYSQWDLDNAPIPSTPLPTNQVPGHEGRIQTATEDRAVALTRAFEALELPIVHTGAGAAQKLMVQVALQCTFRSEEWLNDFPKDLLELWTIYDERIPTIASEFYIEYGAAIWGPGAGKDEQIDDQRIADLRKFLFVLSEQDATRDKTGDDPTEAVKQLARLRRATVPTFSPEDADPDDPNATLAGLYSTLEIQVSDIWIYNGLGGAVAQMAFKELDRVHDNFKGFPCRRPTSKLIDRVVQRILNRYARKLWPKSIAQPEDAGVILHHYIATLTKVDFSRERVGNDAVRMLDGLLELDDGDAEEESHREHPAFAPRTGLECTLAHLAEYESCKLIFASTADVAVHLMAVHDFDQQTADDVVAEC